VVKDYLNKYGRHELRDMIIAKMRNVPYSALVKDYNLAAQPPNVKDLKREIQRLSQQNLSLKDQLSHNPHLKVHEISHDQRHSSSADQGHSSPDDIDENSLDPNTPKSEQGTFVHDPDEPVEDDEKALEILIEGIKPKTPQQPDMDDAHSHLSESDLQCIVMDPMDSAVFSQPQNLGQKQQAEITRLSGEVRRLHEELCVTRHYMIHRHRRQRTKSEESESTTGFFTETTETMEVTRSDMPITPNAGGVPSDIPLKSIDSSYSEESYEEEPNPNSYRDDFDVLRIDSASIFRPRSLVTSASFSNVLTEDLAQEPRLVKQLTCPCLQTLDLITLKNQSLQSENAKLKEHLQQIVIGQGIETAFIKEEDFANHKLNPFRQQTYSNLIGGLTELFEARYAEYDEDDFEDDDDDDGDEDDDKDGNDTDLDSLMSPEAVTKFEIFVDRMACTQLIGILMQCYEQMADRKRRICQIVVEALSITANETQSAEDIAFTMVHTQLQQQWELYLNERFDDKFNAKVGDFRADVDLIMDSENVKSILRLDTEHGDGSMERSLRKYVEKSCELSWIMILTKPAMRFQVDEGVYDKNIGHALRTGSNDDDRAEILFYGFPAVAQAHFSIPDKELLIVKGEVFVHHDPELIEYIKCVPDDL